MIRSLVTLDMLVVDIFKFLVLFLFPQMMLLPVAAQTTSFRWWPKMKFHISQLECCYHWGNGRSTDLGAVRPELQSGLPLTST